MKSQNALFLLFIIVARPLLTDSVVLEALIQVESDNIQMTSFLERFKKFIAQSHVNSGGINEGNETTVEKYIQHNDTFQANYDFSQNLLTIRSSYNLLQNQTGQKISDVKININFRFDQDPNRKIIIEDFHGRDAEPRIGIDNINPYCNRKRIHFLFLLINLVNLISRPVNSPSQQYFINTLRRCEGGICPPKISEKQIVEKTTNESPDDEMKSNENYLLSCGILGTILSPIVNTIELVVVSFFHIVINGILGHVLTSAFEELYHGRLLSN